MNRVIHLLAAVTVVFGVACAAMQQQKSQIRADQGEFKNLKVLPNNITHDELVATMRGYSRALGTKCDHCHAASPDPKGHLDFASDAKPEKNTARLMIRMVESINGQYIGKLDKGDDKADRVACVTCHRGHAIPEVAAAEPSKPPAEATPPPPPPSR